jgi:hypothetical protein
MWVCPEKERAAMQRRLSEVRPATLADQLLGLAKLHDSALKEHWRTLYQTAPPARISSSLLLKAIAYRLQEQALGGLKSSTRRLLERVAEDCGRRAPTRAPATTVRAGSVLIREWCLIAPDPRQRAGMTKLAASRFTSHSKGARKVSSKSLISKTRFRSGVAKPPKFIR